MKGLPLFITFSALFIFSIGITDTSVDRTDESYYFSSAMHMVRSNNWIIPVFENREKRFQKPILFYWLVAISFKLFGISVTSARVASLVFAVLGVGLIFFFSRMLFGSKAGLYSSLLLISSSLYLLNAHAARTDMVFTFFIMLAFFFFSRGFFVEPRPRLCFVLSSMALGMATLTKGPLAVVIFIPSALSLIFSEKNKTSMLKEMFSLPVVSIFLVVVLPWPLLVYFRYGNEFIRYLLQKEVAQRMAGAGPEIFSNLIYYTGVIIRYFFPWSIFFILSLLSIRERGIPGKERLVLTWIAITFFTFSLVISPHRSRYLLPLSPALALLTGRWLADHEEGLFKKPFLRTVLYLGAGLLCLLAFLLFLPSYLSLTLHKTGALVLFGMALFLFAGGLGLFFSMRKEKPRFIVPILTFTTVIAVVLPLRVFLPTVKPEPMKSLALKCPKPLGEKERLIAIELDPHSRVLLTLFLERFLDGIYDLRNISVCYSTMERMENEGKKVFVVLPETVYVNFPPALKRTYPVIGKSFAYSFKKKLVHLLCLSGYQSPAEMFLHPLSSILP